MATALTVSDENEEMLLKVAAKLHVPDDLTTEEKCEIALDHILSSIDAGEDASVGLQDSAPISGEELRAQIEAHTNRVSNPDISTEFVQPSGEPQGAQQQVPTAFDDIVKMAPKNRWVVKALEAIARAKPDDADDAAGVEIVKQSIVTVFAQREFEDWDNDKTGELIIRTGDMLAAHKSRPGA